MSLILSTAAFGQPVPKFYTTLDDDASTTVGGGAIVNGPASYATGAVGNAFAGNGSVYARWQNTQVGTIFSGWNDSLGFTVDLHFQGDHWPSHSGDSGFWAIVRRNGGTDDRYIIAEVKNGKLRLLFSGSGTNVTQYKYTLDGGLTAGETAPAVPLTNGVPYRLTMRQANGAFEVYIDDIGGAVYSNATPIFSATNLPSGYTWTMVPSGGSVNAREMNVARRGAFGGTLQAGEWVDNVRVYNGFYSPTDIDTGGPPSAVISADKTSGFEALTVNFDGSGSFDTDATNVITKYEWDFTNDGTVDATGPTTNHVYAATGDYVCKLTVTDDENQTASSTLGIHVDVPPPPGLLAVTDMLPTGGPLTGSQVLAAITAGAYTLTSLVGPTTVELDAAFDDFTNTGLCNVGAETYRALLGLQLGRGLTSPTVGSAVRGYFPAGVVLNGDGTAGPEIFVLEYAGSTDNFQIQLLTSTPGQPPAWTKSVQVRSIDYGQTSTLMTATGQAVGGVAIDLDAVGASGITGVQIPGDDGSGARTGLDLCVIAAVVDPAATFSPIAVMRATPTSGGAPLPVGFDASCGSYDPDGELTYQWDFTTNGSTDATSMTANHTYTTAGSFLATLTVKDADNLTATDTATINVSGANPKRRITAMLPSGALPAGSHTLTSVTTEMPGSAETFTATQLVGPPDTAHVDALGSMTGGGAGATTPQEAMVGLELGSKVSGLSAPGEFLVGRFPDDVVVNADGTSAPEVFVIEATATDTFQIELMAMGAGQTLEVVASVQILPTDYASTTTLVGGEPRGGVGIDLDALGVSGIRGVQIPGADGQGGGSGVDPVIIAGIPTRCNTPFADSDGDGDVDHADFAVVQLCFTGNAPPPGMFDSIRCFCFDRDKDNDVDEPDYSDFEDCATGPGIPWSPGGNPDCQP